MAILFHFVPFSSHFPPSSPPFLSHSERSSYIAHPDLLMNPHFSPFPPISPIFPDSRILVW